jgi:hypothetical protein
VFPPDTLRLIELPLQIDDEEGVMVSEGPDTAVTVTLDVLVQPFALVAVTV